MSIRQLVETICGKLGVRFEDHVKIVDDRLGKDAAYQLDSKKLRGLLNWKDNINLDKGLDQCIDWVNRNFDILKDQPLHYVHKP